MNAPLFDFWREIPGLPDYFVSRDGLVRSERKGALTRHPQGLLRLRSGTNGYLRFNCTRDGLRGTFEVHRAIALAFHGSPPSPSHHAAHDDGDVSNNTPENVLWKTPAENMADKIRHGVVVRRHSADLLASAHAAYAVGASKAEISRRIGIPTRTLRRHLRSSECSL